MNITIVMLVWLITIIIEFYRADKEKTKDRRYKNFLIVVGIICLIIGIVGLIK